jgi:hypothetical protein
LRTSSRLLAAVLLSTVALLGAGLVPASAATGDHVWTGSMLTASGTSSAVTATWNTSTFALTLSVQTGTLGTGKCVTAFFDWSAKGHHDARALRDCKSGDTVTFSFPDATPSNIVGGPDKLGLCYAALDKKGVCVHGVGTAVPTMDWTPWPDLTRTTPCDLSWSLRASDGTVTSFLDPHSLLPKTSYGAC